MLKIYIAAPLFSEAERKWNKALAKSLKEAISKRKFAIEAKITLPQEFELKHHYGSLQFAEEAYSKCIMHLEESNVVIAVLDGCQVDDGTAFEVGYACAKDIPVLGIRTDPRPGEFNGCNAMLSIGCKRIYCYQNNLDHDSVVDGIILAAQRRL
jgi:nucleoside 2-deoxyribosyltransferase